MFCFIKRLFIIFNVSKIEKSDFLIHFLKSTFKRDFFVGNFLFLKVVNPTAWGTAGGKKKTIIFKKNHQVRWIIYESKMLALCSGATFSQWISVRIVTWRIVWWRWGKGHSTPDEGVAFKVLFTTYFYPNSMPTSSYYLYKVSKGEWAVL